MTIRVRIFHPQHGSMLVPDSPSEVCTGRTYPLSLFLTEYGFVAIAGGSEGFIWHHGTGNDDPPATLAEKLKDVLKLCVTWGFVGTVTGAPDPDQAAPAPQTE